jgi:uncharacterized protein YlxW (UPF0749 family)
MTLLGKFFTAVIFLLSAIFLFAALAVNASHRNWRQYVLEGVNGEAGLKTQIENLTRNRTQLENEKQAIQTSLDREQASRRTALASLQTQLDQLQGELIQSQSRVQQLTAQSTNLIQLDASRTQQLDQLIKENVDLRDSVRKEQQNRDTLFTQTLKLTDEANQLRGLKQQLEERNKQMLSQVTRYEEVVTSKGIDVNDPLDGAPPQRNGKVLVINRPNQLALISIGYDEGLRQGHLLEVTRAGKYVGKLRVSKTEPDRSVAEILEDFSELTLQEGDRVDTTFE